MGIKLKINYILRQDVDYDLEIGQEYEFEKELCLIADDISIWLTKKDWTVLAEIQITSQCRKGDKTTGTFLVKHVYSGDEQKYISTVLKRMYGWD